MVLALMVQLCVTQAGCTKDTDCKGDRVCEAGVCVSPKSPVDLAPAVTPPPPPPPAPLAPAPASASEEWPRVVRRDGLVCVQSLGADGRIEESCRAEKAEPVVMPTRKRARPGQAAQGEAEEPRARFVMDFLAQGGANLLVASAGALVLPQLSGQLSLGARFRSGVGVVGVGALTGMFGYGLTALLGTVAPGVRFGDRSHFTLAAGTSFGGFSSAYGSGGGLMFTLLAQGVFAVAGAFGLALGGQFSIDASGLMLGLSAGIAFGAF